MRRRRHSSWVLSDEVIIWVREHVHNAEVRVLRTGSPVTDSQRTNNLPRVKDKIGEVIGLIHSPAHTAPLAKIKFDDGTEGHMAAPEGISVGQPVSFGENVELRPGNVTILGSIPEGTPVSNVESRPGDGGKFARSGGNSAIVESRTGDKVRIRLPSGRIKELLSTCRATIGVLGGHGRTEKPLMKAGGTPLQGQGQRKAVPDCIRCGHESSRSPSWWR